MSREVTSSGRLGERPVRSCTRKAIRWILAAALLSAIPISIARSQGGIVVSTETLINPHFEPGGSQISRNFGASVLFADLDGLAGQEVIVGAPGDWLTTGSNPPGYVFVFFASLAGGPFTSYSIQAPSPYTEEGDNLFGYALAAGDVNGDGAMDLIVGAPGVNASGPLDDSGAAFVYLGPWSFQLLPVPYASVTTINHVPRFNAKQSARFGFAVAAQNLDSFGDAEIVISAPFYSVDAQSSLGFALVLGFGLSAFDNVASAPQLLSANNDGGMGHEVGRSISLGNVDAILGHDVVLGCSSWADPAGNAETGKVQNYLNNVFDRSQTQHLDQPGTNQARQKFGKSCAVGDFNFDFFHDLAIGGPNFENLGGGGPPLPDSLVVVYMSPVDPNNSSKYASVSLGGPTNAFGFGLAWADIDGDSTHELAITDFMRTTQRGIVDIYDVTNPGAVTLTYLRSLQDPSPSDGSQFGYSIRAGRRAGFPNRDDFVVGAPGYQINGEMAGKVVIFNH